MLCRNPTKLKFLTKKSTLDPFIHLFLEGNGYAKDAVPRPDSKPLLHERTTAKNRVRH